MNNMVFKLCLILLFSFDVLSTTSDDGDTLSLDDIQVDKNTLKYSGNGIAIAVIEGGFYPHDAINANLTYGYDSKCDKPIDPSGNFVGHSNDLHGVHVVGTICAQPLVEYRFGGLAYNAQIIPVINDNGMFSIRDHLDRYCRAFKFAIDSGARIISISQPLFEKEAIKPLIIEGVKKGIIFVVAIGNDGQSKLQKPLYNVDNNIIGALASDEEIKPGFVVVGALSKFSGKSNSPYNKLGYSFGRFKLKNGIGGSDYYSNEFQGNFIWAPGEDIVSCGWDREQGSTYRRNSGTSMATPLVTSVIALLMEKFPEATNAEIVSKLMSCPGSMSEYEKTGEIGKWPILNCAHLFADANADDE